ncbi:MAG: serine/threonine protein kinase [Myxococcales bacterium]|nr:serine/threonine protein kinase [Myxococcales bacterium]
MRRTLPREGPRGSEDSEKARGFLQERVALFWKVVFLITLCGSGLGLLGAIVKPGMDLVVTLGEMVLAGSLSWLCSRHARSIRFLWVVDGLGLFVLSGMGAFLGRFLSAGFARGHAVTSAEGVLMADGYVSMMTLVGTALMVVIRAAVIPARPSRTALVTAAAGLPLIAVSTLVVLDRQGGLALRGFASSTDRWLPAIPTLMWGFTVLTCVVISRVVHGLEAEVRQARRFGQYVLEQKIGEGAMGVVYRATHAMLRRPAAIKLLLREHASEEDLQRFEREVQLTSRLAHPNTISVFDYGRTTDGVFYYVMEYLDGMDLHHLVDRHGPVDPARAIHILAQIAGALAEAHALGLVHRDIKPANIILTERPDEPDVVKVLDFGLVKSFSGEAGASAAGAIVGTPLYMAPEAVRHPNTIDARADLYAVGAVGYFLLCGRDVFEARSLVEICAKHLLEAPEPPSQKLGRPLPTDLEALVLSCLAKDREDRPSSAAVLRAALLACTDAGAYDVDAARRWWRARAAAQPDETTAGIARAATMEIDLYGRTETSA